MLYIISQSPTNVFVSLFQVLSHCRDLSQEDMVTLMMEFPDDIWTKTKVLLSASLATARCALMTIPPTPVYHLPCYYCEVETHDSRVNSKLPRVKGYIRIGLVVKR